MMRPRIVLERVSKLYGPRPQRALERLRTTGALGADASIGVHEVSLSIPEGQTFVLMGLSGSGKSTLLRLLNGLYRPTAGRVLVGGTDLATLKRRELVRFRRRTYSGMVFQGFALLPYRTALGNVAFGLELQGVGRRERLERSRRALALVGLEADASKFPAELSGGMQQRLGLARALTLSGDILLMDEPFSALDPITRRELQGELRRLQAHVRKTTVLVTHDLDEALRLGDHIAVLKGGAVQQVGTPEEIVTRPCNAYVAAFVAGVDRAAVLTASSIMTPPAGGGAQGGAPQVRSDTPLSEVVRLSAADARTLSVVGEAGQLLGVITQQDVLAALAQPSPGGP
jgi:glycine betaine/proline transport system ATP-binding protein